MLKSVYHAVLAYELAQRGFRADVIVEDKVMVEIKSVEALAPQK